MQPSPSPSATSIRSRLAGRTGAIIVAELCFFAGIAQLAWYFPAMPDTVITQWNMDGTPGMQISKAYFGATYLVVLLFCQIYTAGIGFFLPHLPQRYFRILPHHDHWLSDHHRTRTYASLSARLMWLVNATLLLFLGIYQVLFMANQTSAQLLPLAPGSLISMLTTLYLTSILIALFSFKKRFGTPPQ